MRQTESVEVSTSRLHESAVPAIVGEPEVVEDTRDFAAGVKTSAPWLRLKDAATALRAMQAQDGSVPDSAHHIEARSCVESIVEAIRDLAPRFPHDAAYLAASQRDF